MTREDVIAVWGEPVLERVTAGWAYMYFRNGCEVSCGTYDVVFLQEGQVVDGFSGATPLAIAANPPGNVAVVDALKEKGFDFLSMATGSMAGSIGETCALTVLCLECLLGLNLSDAEPTIRCFLFSFIIATITNTLL